jgi:uncharacterized repeat protein (TIGR03803 family)
MDKAGTLFGTTFEGGAFGLGTVFKVDTGGDETVLHHFGGLEDGATPRAGLVLSNAGDFYGTTYFGGNSKTCNPPSGCGTVFKLDRNGKYTVLYRFVGGAADGVSPAGDLVRDSEGNLYGTTTAGGTDNLGTVFKVRARKETVLYSFVGGTDGANPMAGLLRDKAGNLYGTTIQGGGTGCPNRQGCGTVFKIDTTGHETVLYAFTGKADGEFPDARLVQDAAGNLYGTTQGGGTGCPKSKRFGCGTAFKLDASNRKTVLYNFTGNGGDGRFPVGGLAIDSTGNLYGTTEFGGGRKCGSEQGCGTVFKLTP